jgi:hypothetical protein
MNIALKINAKHKEVRSGYILAPNEQKENCEERINYNVKGEPVFANEKFVSYMVFATKHAEGWPHPNTQYAFVSCSVVTGAQINFTDIIKPESIASFKSFAVELLRMQYPDAIGSDAEAEKLQSQVDNMEFSFADNGLVLHFRGDTYATTLMDLVISYDELKPYLQPKFVK